MMSEDNFLIISFFDMMQGPRIFYFDDFFVESTNPRIEKILGIHDIRIYENETFVFSFQNYYTLNYLFYLDSKYQSRGGREQLMITLMCKQNGNLTNYSLDAKEDLIKQFAEELKTINHLPYFLNSNNVISLNQNDPLLPAFKEEFLQVYDKYRSLLVPKQSLSLKENDYETLKIHCPLCKSITSLKIPERIIKNARNIDLMAVKLNVKPKTIAEIIHALIFHQKVVIIVTNELIDLIRDLEFMIEFIFQNSFQLDYSFLIPGENKDIGEIKENVSILDLNTSHSNKNLLKMDVNMIMSFYTDDSLTSVFNLKDKIHEIYLLSNKFAHYIKNNGHDAKNPMNQKEIINYLEETQYIQVNAVYLKYLTEILRSRYKTNITFLQETIAKQIEILWGYTPS